MMTCEEREPVWLMHNKSDTYCLCGDRSMTTMHLNETEDVCSEYCSEQDKWSTLHLNDTEDVCSEYCSEQDKWSTLSFSSPDDLLCDDIDMSDDDIENSDDDIEKNDDQNNDHLVFDMMVSRLTPLPNKWCSRTGTFVFEIIEPVIETVPVDSMKKQWEVVPSVAVAISDIMGEQEEEEKILEKEREKRRQRQEALAKNKKHNDGRRTPRQFDRFSQQSSSKNFENEPRRRPSLLMNMRSSEHVVEQNDGHAFKTAAPERRPPSNQRQQNRIDILCAFQKNHSRTCNFVHSLTEWKPRECKYEKTCSRGDACMYWHKKTEDKKQYLERALVHDVPSFKKYKDHYMSTYIKKK